MLEITRRPAQLASVRLTKSWSRSLGLVSPRRTQNGREVGRALGAPAPCRCGVSAPELGAGGGADSFPARNNAGVRRPRAAAWQVKSSFPVAPASGRRRPSCALPVSVEDKPPPMTAVGTGLPTRGRRHLSASSREVAEGLASAPRSPGSAFPGTAEFEVRQQDSSSQFNKAPPDQGAAAGKPHARCPHTQRPEWGLWQGGRRLPHVALGIKLTLS